MEDEDAARRARDLLLAHDVLIPVQARRAHPGEVAAGDEAGSALSGLDSTRVPEQLDVERRVGGVGRSIHVEWLDGAASARNVVHPVVVEHRMCSDE